MASVCQQADLSKEIIRIGTFTGWPVDEGNSPSKKPGPIELAESGFYFTGNGDEVKCFSCNVTFKKWEMHNIPNVVHATISPLCPFIVEKGASNKRVFVPEEKEYNAILKMLDQINAKTVHCTQSNQTFSSSLICDTLKILYGESMLADSRRARARPGTSASDPRSSSSSPARPTMSKETRVRGGKRGTRTASQSSIPESPPPSPERRNSNSNSNNNPLRTSSNSNANTTTTTLMPNMDRPQFQRTRSYAPDPRVSRSHSETIANRQTSNPGMDHAEYQESEQARLATFNQWPSIRGSSAREFAQAGFIFLGHPDRMQCVFCSGILRNWNDNDVPMEEHSKHFPQCSFVKEYHSSAVNVAKLRHPKYKTEPSRLGSFQNKNWPNGNIPSPQELSKAGFFYVGHGDSVKCFFCDGGLRNWESDDDPWREHARWFPTCGYVKQAKGKVYIDSVVRNTNMAEYQTASVDQTSVKSLATQGQREVDPREVMARMDSAIVKTVLKMDIPKRLVEKAISKRLAENGQDFSTSEALLEAVFNLDLQVDQQTALKSVKEPALKNTVEAVAGKGGGEGEEKKDGDEDAKEIEDSMRLAEENRLLKEQRQCKICMDEEVCMAFLPCGHLVCCSTCAPALNSCPICRAKVRGTVRTYLS